MTQDLLPDPDDTLIGAVTETAPTTDTASSGLNGRLQRIAQRLTSLIAVFGIGPGTEAAAIRVTLPTDGTGQVIVVGNVAHDAVDSGGPIKIGGKARSTLPTNTAAADRVDAWFGLTGQQVVAPGVLNAGYDTNPNVLAPISAYSAADIAPLWVAPSLYDGTNFPRQRGNTDATLLASAARTATTNSPDQINYNGRGCHVSLDVTVEGPATLSLKIQGKHSVGGTYYDIVDFGTVYTAASDAPGPKTVSLYPGILTADHVGVGAGISGTIGKSAVLPRVWRAVVTHSDATTCTYSLSAVTIL